jgi:signal transduction histidine kinase
VSSLEATYGAGHGIDRGTEKRPEPEPEQGAEASHAETAAETRVKQLLALNKAAVAITSELELDNLLQRIVDAARELANCKYAALGVLGDDGFIVRFPTSGISEAEREQIGAPPRGHGLLGVMLRAGRTLRIPDISKDPRRIGFPPHHPRMTSLLGVPIFVLGKLVGDLYLSDKIDGPEFSEEDEWLVQLLATHAATALTNSILHAENVQALELAGRERARSDALANLTHAINRSVHLDEVIGLILQSTVELLDAVGAAIYLLHDVAPHGRPHATPESALEGAGGSMSATEAEGARHFVARYAVGLEEVLTTEASLLPVDRSLAGRAVMSGQPQVVDDVAQEPNLILPSLAGKTLRSLAAVPLQVGVGQAQGQAEGHKTLGALSAYSDRPYAFDGEAMRLLEAFASAASTALNNASLYEAAQQGREGAEREGQRLRELEQMKDEFLSTAAHELRTPLTTIRMSAGLALEQIQRLAALDEIDPRIADLISLVVDSSQRMQSLVNDLLDLTRLEQGRAVLTFENLDLRDVVSAAVKSVGPIFESKHQKLDVRLPEYRCSVRGDRPRLEQVVINLLSNANKYSPPNTEVEIRCLRLGDECLVTVRDGGPGVPEDEREQIFERFYRSTLHRNDRTPSTGLGLPIARKVAEMHMGRVWVEPAPHKGSIFTLALPRVGT